MPTMNLENIADISGNGRGLTLGGSVIPSFDANAFGTGIPGCVMDASVQFAAWGPDWIPAAGDYTWDFRFKRNTAENSVVQVVFGRWGTPGQISQYQYLCYWDVDNQLKFYHATAPTAAGIQLASGAITDGSAHAYRVVYSSGQLSMYVDGARVAGPTSVGALGSCEANTAFIVGNYDDREASRKPLYGTLGELRLSNVARSTGTTYSVPTTPLESDGNTVALLQFSGLSGTYMAAPSYVGAALRRTGYSQASGGWANPDGPLPKIGGGWFFTASAFNGTVWSLWAVTASTLADLISGAGTVGAQAIQTPVSGVEGDLAANGSVVAWGGTYYHYYHDSGPGNGSVRYSSGTDLGAPFSPQPGNVIFTGYSDIWVRSNAAGTKLVMYMVGAIPGARNLYRSESTDAVTWSAPALVLKDIRQSGYASHVGEFAHIEETATEQTWGWSDGAPGTNQSRRLLAWGKRDAAEWFPLGKNIEASGSDASSVPYLSCFDASPFFDESSSKIYMLAAHSTNSQPTQPTASDIGVWEMQVYDQRPSITGVTASNITSSGARITLGLTR